MKKEFKKYKLEQFLNDPQSDSGTGLLVFDGDNLCFTIKQTHRWGKTKENTPIIPFGGIGGKLEKNESLVSSLQRETLEEVGSKIKIFENLEETLLMDSESVIKIKLETDLLAEPLPDIIFHSPKAEIGRKPFTNIFIYRGQFVSKNIIPKDDPAIIRMGMLLLTKMINSPMTVRDFKLAGGKIKSRIDLPENGILRPVGTAIAIAHCLKIC